MSHAALESVAEHFAELDDPRRQNAHLRHELVDILAIGVCAAIGGANHWTDVASFAEAKEDWFRRFLRLPDGIPSHDTFSDVFARIDAQVFERGFIGWVESLGVTLPGLKLSADAARRGASGRAWRRRCGRRRVGRAAGLRGDRRRPTFGSRTVDAH